MNPWRNYFFGVNTPIYTPYGLTTRTFLNNAATPQILKPVIQQFSELLDEYAYDNEPNVISARMRITYNEVRETVLDYIDGDPLFETVIFTQNTTTAINLVSHIFKQYDPDQVVLTTRMEHMANYLPYKENLNTVLIGLTPEGNIDLDDYQSKLDYYKGRVKLVAVTGASNITGIIPPYHRMAALAHDYGAKIFLDAVQLVQHKLFSMKPRDDNEHIDFLSFDGHKCYTGQSGGVLVGDKSFLDRFEPMIYGAGISDFVSDEHIVYREAPERFEAGYPDFLGIISLGNALRFLKKADIIKIEKYESELYRYMLNSLRNIPKIILYGTVADNHIPVVSFNINGIAYQELGKRLGYDYGIAVASGTSGSNIYVQDLLELTNEQAYKLFVSGQGFGVVRVSLGMYNSYEDIDRLADALSAISGRIT